MTDLEEAVQDILQAERLGLQDGEVKYYDKDDQEWLSAESPIRNHLKIRFGSDFEELMVVQAMAKMREQTFIPRRRL